MTSNELKELVKKHFSLVEADATSEEIINEEFTAEKATEEVAEEIVEEVFGEIADINDAFIIKFPGDSLQVGDKVEVVTEEGQSMDAPDGEHELKDGTKIVTEDSVVKEIKREEAGAEEEMAEQFDARTDAEEEGYKDGMEDAIEDIKEAVAEVAKEDMEEEVSPSIEAVVKEIADAVKEEMGKMKEKMAELEEKVAGIADAPAAEPVMKKNEAVTSFKRPEKFASFDVSKAKNADRIAAAIRMMKK